MSDRVDFQEFVAGFVAEADELIAIASSSLLDIDAGQKAGAVRPKAVRELFRALHTIKGLAGMIGVEPIVDVAHAVETLVRTADKNGGRLRRGAIDVCLQGVRAISERVRAVADGRTPAPVSESLLDDIAAADAASEPAVPPPPIAAEWDNRLSASERHHLFESLRAGKSVWSMVFRPSDDKANRGITIASVRGRLTEIGEIIKVIPRAVDGGVAFDILAIAETTPDALAVEVSAEDVSQVQPPPEAIAPLQTESPDDHDPVAVGRSLVRVELARLDDLQEQLSQLIVSRFRLEREIARLAMTGASVRGLRDIAELQARQLRGLRRAILRARLVSLDEVLEPLTLLVRSASRATGREVKLQVDSGGNELDKAVADRLLPAIVHLVRNAVDHGLESPDDRAAAGKPRAGTIVVGCHEAGGNQLELTIRDDGRGIDREAVGRRARRDVSDDAALLDVLTTPGFSTRDVATQTSGRGVGMDVVRRIVSELGGDLTLTTEQGVGTTFTLRVPLTIAIVDAFSFECSGQTFVVPVTAIEEIFEIDARVSPAAPDAAIPATLVERRGRPVTLLALGDLLALTHAEPKKALVVRRNTDLFAFGVDRMLGRQELVVRPVDDPLVRMPGIAGTTDLGDGRPTLVLDLVELGHVLAQRQVS